ncbi:MAG TPA: nucleoside-diphosphate sugar epimerase/dehydratase [Tepidisphaeraceae bacterium]|nr:nucleoside-diphosphate sugar epimerase/dehydratase [Tepidisphaeraceae bacterium]
MRSIFKQLRKFITRSKNASAGVDIFQLLGREPVCLDTPELQRFLAGKSILVTGAGGSIGSEICRQAMKFCPKRLVLVERAENALFEIDRELRERWIGADIRPCLADICDRERIESIFKEECPDVVFHCAAHKHVPLMEENPGEAVKNNVFGTKIVADAAVDAGSHAFVMVSTDKAVNPTSVMGATKRCAELYVQSLNGGGVTRLVGVRFGNVIGSSGSVVPIFQKQIAAGGPVTVTHPEMKRYFMTIPEASQLVMQAGAIGRGGEIFILDMGEPVKILDLATQMILRNGLRPDEDIQIKFTGVRPGEKLYEELSANNEQTRPTSHEKIRVWQLPVANSEQVELMLETLNNSLPAGSTKIVDALKQCVGEYEPKRAAAPAPEKSRIPLRLVRAA